MSTYNLDKMFHPKTIALIGASPNPQKLGYMAFDHLKNSGFNGNIIPVNPHHKIIKGQASFSSVNDIESPVDLAIITLPELKILNAVKECANTKVGGAVILSAIGKEHDKNARHLENELMDISKASGVRLISSNYFGVICTQSNLNASLSDRMPLAGKIAFVSQSGAICSAVLDLSFSEQMGFSYMMSLGSFLDVDVADMIDFLGCDPNVSSIVLYLEHLTHIRKFMSAARAVSRIKPIIALKAGRSLAGTKAAGTHTGVIVSPDMAYEGAFDRSGIVRVKTFEELFDCAELLSKYRRPSKTGLGIVTNAGGPGVMAADALSDYGFEPAVLTVETMEKLAAILPPAWSHANPIDILGDAEGKRFADAIQIGLNAPEIDGLLVIYSPQREIDSARVARSMLDILADHPKKIFICWMGGPSVQAGRKLFNSAGIPTFDSPERAIRAFIDLYQYSVKLENLMEIPSKFNQRLKFDRHQAARIIEAHTENVTALSENIIMDPLDSKALLEAYGIPINSTQKALDFSEALDKAHAFGYPVVMKICAPNILHKSQVQGVCLEIDSDETLSTAYENMTAKGQAQISPGQIVAVTLEPMLKNPCLELILGVKTDPGFGPIILFGPGGHFSQIYPDHAIALPPLNRSLARKLIEKTTIYKILNTPGSGFIHAREKIEEILIRLSQLVTDFSQIIELDINPLIITKDQVLAVDAKVIIQTGENLSPNHLVISPYPNQYEKQIVLDDGTALFIRPIRPEDAPNFTEFFNSLSLASVYNRFFSPIKQLTHQMLARFTQIDYDREMAIVCFEDAEKQEDILGVARIITMLNKNQVEFAIIVSDAWHGKGVGTQLLTSVLKIAKDQGVQRVWGTTLAENRGMLKLASKLGFTTAREPGTTEYELILDL